MEVLQARVDAAPQGGSGAPSLKPRPLASRRPRPHPQGYLSLPQSPQFLGSEHAESRPQGRLQRRQHRPAQGRLHRSACEGLGWVSEGRKD